MIDLAVGAGRHDAIGGWDVAPSAAYRFTSGDFRGRVVAERMLTPVWSDLAPGVNPFLQRTWVAGWDVHSEARGSVGGELGLLLGTTQDRAIVQRLPLEEMWLRNGLVPDTGRYDFGLFTAGAHWQGRVLLGTADGFALARAKSAVQPAVDPPYGGRGSLGFGFQAFQRELDVKLRAEVEGVGPRESETAVPQRIPGYASLGFAAALTLRDATLTFRAQNLEDQGRLQTWIDPNTGRLALGVGREIHFEFAWKLFN
jgi:hypothetical protein